VADNNIPNINSDKIMKAIKHIANSGKDMENLLLVITNEIFRQGKVSETLKVGLLTV
jgi:hypothetical protein